MSQFAEPTFSKFGNDLILRGIRISEQKNVVRFEEIPWISVREADPQNPVYSRVMNITSLPSNLLYDPQGNIVNTNLTGRNLLIRMDQIFNK